MFYPRGMAVTAAYVNREERTDVGSICVPGVLTPTWETQQFRS